MTVRRNGNAGRQNGLKRPGVTSGVTKIPSKINTVTAVTPVTAPRGVYMNVPVNGGGVSVYRSMCTYHRYHRYPPLYLSIYLIEKERKIEGNGWGNGGVTPRRDALPFNAPLDAGRVLTAQRRRPDGALELVARRANTVPARGAFTPADAAWNALRERAWMARGGCP